MKKLPLISPIAFVCFLALFGFCASQAQADFTITSNLSTVEVSGAVNDFAASTTDGYQDGIVYSSTTLPIAIEQDDLIEGEASIDTGNTATAFSDAELTLDIVQDAADYHLFGGASSSADTEIDSLSDNDATAFGEATVDFAFTLSSPYNFTFEATILDSLGSGVAEIELISIASGTVFSEVVEDGSSEPTFSGFLPAGDYTLFLGASSEGLDGDFASADIEFDLQLSAVPEPTSLALLVLGVCGVTSLRRRRA